MKKKNNEPLGGFNSSYFLNKYAPEGQVGLHLPKLWGEHKTWGETTIGFCQMKSSKKKLGDAWRFGDEKSWKSFCKSKEC